MQEKRILLSNNKNIYADIISTDVCYADNTGKHFKRIFINNCLDPRYQINLQDN